MKKLYSITICGKRKKWNFKIWLDPKYLDEWRKDGLIIEEVINTIPAWYATLGMPLGLWCFVEDIFNFKNPFKK